ncbi:MAG: hypothetical protein L3J47_08760 [Sulfurovum sp.]|nr:hypothetical protein [Sulfurovum sp.]
MYRSLLFLSLFLSASVVSIAAEKYDTKAFRTVTKLCTPCHGTPFYMAKQLDEDDWDFFFNTKGKLEKIHKASPKGLTAVKNPRFIHHKKRILKFFIVNSKYSGAVHGCDANFCGTHH